MDISLAAVGINALVKPVLEFAISNNNKLDNLGKELMNNALSLFLKKGEGKLTDYYNDIGFRIHKSIKETTEQLHLKTDAADRMEADLAELLESVSDMHLSDPRALSNKENLYEALKMRYERGRSDLSDSEKAHFLSALNALCPILFDAICKSDTYIYELLWTEFSYVLQIQQGTNDISRKLDRVEKLLKEQHLKPETMEERFYHLWNGAQLADSNGSEDVAKKYEELLIFLNEQISKGMFDELCLILANPETDVENRIQWYKCVGDHRRLPLFYAQTLVRTANTNLEVLAKNQEENAGNRFQIRGWLDQAEGILRGGRANIVSDWPDGLCSQFCEKLEKEINIYKNIKLNNIPKYIASGQFDNCLYLIISKCVSRK